MKPWSSTWSSNCKSPSVTRMFSVDWVPGYLERTSRKPWKSRSVCTNNQYEWVTLHVTIVLWLQSILVLMPIKQRYIQISHNILSVNSISTWWQFISWITFLNISASVGTSNVNALPFPKLCSCILTKCTDNGIVMRPPCRFREPKPISRWFTIESWMETLKTNLPTMRCLCLKCLSSE